MPKFTIPDDREARILRENHLDPNQYAVMHTTATYIILICYETRDTITIGKGDRQW